MNQIYKIAWIGLAINVLTCFVFLATITVLSADYSVLSSREQYLVDKSLIVNALMVVFILLEVVNLFVILKMPKYAKISSFIVSSFFPFGAVYFIGCLLSIQRVTLSPFSEYQGNNAADSAVYFVRDRYWKKACIFGGLTLVMLIHGAINICMMIAAMHFVSYRKTEDRCFFAEKEDGFLLTPTALSKTIFLPYGCINKVEERENSVLVAVYLNQKIDIVFSKKFIAREDLVKIIESLSQAASNNQGNIITLEM
ncbi:hypothetical protein [Photorhabdus hindustanensis]|uniref:Uncharacterized protein n=1 Tax=Photorhabdus hindustanensis TaxID=2918802 RepID=A0A2S8Q3V8_9GAMM|nr:hypothetical protein [Photorhabdus hindustanensis]PQQ26862.1 hypothetical protein C6H66_08465 [Photorhabdus hindustanensis]